MSVFGPLPPCCARPVEGRLSPKVAGRQRPQVLRCNSPVLRCGAWAKFFEPVVDFIIAACATIIDEPIVFYVKNGPLRIDHVAVFSKLAAIYVLDRAQKSVA